MRTRPRVITDALEARVSLLLRSNARLRRERDEARAERDEAYAAGRAVVAGIVGTPEPVQVPTTQHGYHFTVHEDGTITCRLGHVVKDGRASDHVHEEPVRNNWAPSLSAPYRAPRPQYPTYEEDDYVIIEPHRTLAQVVQRFPDGKYQVCTEDLARLHTVPASRLRLATEKEIRQG